MSSESKLFLLSIIAVCGVSFYFYDDVFAAQYSWNESPMPTITWSSVGSNPIFIDSDKNGDIDCIMNMSYNSTAVTFTRSYGTSCVPLVSVKVTLPGSDGQGNENVKLWNDEIYVGRHNGIPNATLSKVNWKTGTSSADMLHSTIIRSGIGFNTVGHDYFISAFNTPTLLVGASVYNGLCPPHPSPIGGGGICVYITIKNSTNTIYNYECYQTQVAGTGSGGFSGNRLTDSSWTWQVNQYCVTPGSINHWNILSGSTSAQTSGLKTGWCSGTSCSNNYGINSLNISPVSIGAYVISPTIKINTLGIEIPGQLITNGSNYSLKPTLSSDLWKNLMQIDKVSDFDKLSHLHYKILGLSSQKPLALYNSTGTYRLVDLNAGTISDIFPTSFFDNRAWDLVVIDDYTGATSYNNKAIGTALTAYTHILKTPSLTTSSQSLYGGLILPSGWVIKVDTGTTLRDIFPKWSDSKDFTPSFLGITSGLTSLSVEIKGAPTDYAARIYDLGKVDTEKILWSVHELTADHSFAVDLPTGKCVTIIGITTDIIPGDETDYGTLCASGVMPKQLIYTQNLAFTFWNLPFGASHTYDQNSGILKTKVRSDTQPFGYTVKVYNADNSLYNSTTYSGITTNSTTFDLKSYNASGSTKPSKIEIYDDNNKLVYYATIGVPSYLSGVGSFFAQYMSIDGFNILYMLPIIFAAMFTRNSVSIGTGLTVVFIATLSYLGLITIPDLVIYLLIFIAVVGMLAYRLLRD